MSLVLRIAIMFLSPSSWLLFFNFVKVFLINTRHMSRAEKKFTLQVSWRCFVRGFNDSRLHVTRTEGDQRRIVDEEMGRVSKDVH